MDLISTLAQNGLLAVLLAISLLTNYRLFILLMVKTDKIGEEKDKRVDDAKRVVESNVQPIISLQKSVELLSTKLDTFINKNGK